MEWYLTVLKRYAEFNGRSRRKEYWMFTLYNSAIFVVLYLAGLLTMMKTSSIAAVFFVLAFIYWLAVLVPSLAVSVRRLHDIDKSGWFLLIGFIPLVGIVLLVFVCLDGTPGDNRFGPNPKAVISGQVSAIS